MSDQPKTYNNVGELFHDMIAPTIDQNTRTYIVLSINHNNESKVQMNGNDLDFPWLLKLADTRLAELIVSKKVP